MRRFISFVVIMGLFAFIVMGTVAQAGEPVRKPRISYADLVSGFVPGDIELSRKGCDNKCLRAMIPDLSKGIAQPKLAGTPRAQTR